MKNRHQGFIFFMTLIVISVISLLVLTSMQHILLYYKAINRQDALHQNFYQLEEVTLQLAKSSLASIEQACVAHKDSANQSIQKLIAGKGCSLKNANSEYRYFIEDLGQFPCLLVSQKGKKHATSHRRVAVVQIEEGQPASLLQIRYITVGRILKCQTQEHMITLGVSSWRYFPGIDSFT